MSAENEEIERERTGSKYGEREEEGNMSRNLYEKRKSFINVNEEGNVLSLVVTRNRKERMNMKKAQSGKHFFPGLH